MKAVFDTNILIDYLNGHAAAKREIDRYDSRLISLITWMEIMAGAKDAAEEAILRGFLRQFGVCEISRPIAEQAVKLRRTDHARLPDAIIHATAKQEECLLITRNTRDFDRNAPDVRVPYRL